MKEIIRKTLMAISWGSLGGIQLFMWVAYWLHEGNNTEMELIGIILLLGPLTIAIILHITINWIFTPTQNTEI